VSERIFGKKTPSSSPKNDGPNAETGITQMLKKEDQEYYLHQL